MRSKNLFSVLRYDDDANIYYLGNNGKWVETRPCKTWNNSGNAWRCIAKLTRAKHIPFKELFVAQGLELTPFTQADAISFACLLAYTSDAGEIDALALEALQEKAGQIEELEETLTELRVAMVHGSEDD